MLDQLRQGAQGWVSKGLMALLVLSFAVWGIGGFNGYHSGSLARVGGQDVSIQDFARIFDTAQRSAQQRGQTVNPEQVLSGVLMNAAIDDAAHSYGLGISDSRVAEEIAKNPAFQGLDGKFDRNRFINILANANINRNDFVSEVKSQLVRDQIAGSLDAGLGVPQPLVAALYRLQNEERTISFFVVDQTAIEAVGTPSDSDLQSYFNDNKDKYRAPEYRKLGLLTLDPAAIADPASVSDAAVAAEYARRKPSLVVPEKRHVEVMRFDSADAAKAALAKIEGGEDFAKAAKDSGVEVTDLGVKTEPEMLDQAVGKAAFAAEKNKPVAVIEGALQPTIIEVTDIEPGSVPSLQDMTAEIRKDLATRAARDRVQDLYNKVEDESAGGSTLQETAKKLSLPYRVIDAVSADLKAPDGSAITDIPDGAEVVKQAFESDVGVENNPIGTGTDSSLFYEVLDVTPAHDRTLAEVRDKVIADWTAAETEKRITARADKLFQELKGGASIATVAAEVGKTVKTVEGIKRNGTSPDLSANAISQSFAGPEGHVADAEGTGPARILLHVDKVTDPAFFAQAANSKAIQSQLSDALKNDLFATFNQQLLASRSTTINTAAFQQLTGQGQTQ